MTTDLITIPKLSGGGGSNKRKASDPPPEPAEKKHKRQTNLVHPLIERNFDDDMGRMFWPLMTSGKDVHWSVRDAGSGFLLHVQGLAGISTKKLIDDILTEMHTRYEIHKVTYGLMLKFMDVRFSVVKSTDRRTGILSNVLKLDVCDAPTDMLEKARKEIEASKVDINDISLISRLIAHAETIQRDNTPEDLKMTVHTPNGLTIKCSGEPPEENKEGKRVNYEFVCHGYEELSRAEFDSFAHVLPFHAHSPTLDWDRGLVCVQLEPYLTPRLGHPVDLYQEMA